LRNAFAIARCDAIVTGSRERRRHYVEQNYVDPHKVVRIPFGVDTVRFCPQDEGRHALRRELGAGNEQVVLGAAGHFGKEKGIDVVLKGFALLAQRRPDLPLLLVIMGEGTPEQQRQMQALADRAVGGRVRFLGFRPDVECWFRAFDLFVHAPRFEAFGLVVAEAMATGLPVVATRVGGVPDLVEDDRTGLLTPPDSPIALADALERLITDRGAWQAMGRTARQRAVDEFSAEVYTRRYLEVYRDLVAGRSPRGVDAVPAHGVSRERRLDFERKRNPLHSPAPSRAAKNEWTPRGVS
jgi:glycosyltransferase involved in cell wall biosynthesis